MITAKEALKLTREHNDYEEKLKYYTELADTSIKEAAKNNKRYIIMKIDDYDVAKSMTATFLDNEYTVREGFCGANGEKYIVLTVTW